MRLISLLSLIFILLKLATVVEGHDKGNKFIITGRVKTVRGKSDSIKITVINLSENCRDTFFINGNKGKVKIVLPFNKNYFIDFEKEGFFKKRLDVSTNVPDQVFSKDPYFKAFRLDVKLHESVEGYEPDFSREPIARIMYSNIINDFDAVSMFDDKEIVRQIKVAKKESLQRAFNGHIAKAQKLEYERKLEEALFEYKIAHNITPGEAFVQEKIKELSNGLLQAKRSNGVISDFDKFLQQGDLMYLRGEYSEALSAYLKALKISPGNANARLKRLKTETAIKETEKAEALKAAEKEQEFKTIIKNADAHFSAERFELAGHLFNYALILNPHNAYVKKRIKEISSKLDELASDRMAFKTSMIIADSMFVKGEFDQALNHYLQAEALKPEDFFVKGRISDTKQMISDIAERQEAFEAALKDAYANMENQNYKSAVSSLSKALEIFPDSITILEQKMFSAGERYCEKAVEYKIFEELRLSADSQFISGNYSASSDLYLQALNFKAEEKYIAERLSESKEKLRKSPGEKESTSKEAKEERQFINFMKQGDIAWNYECYTEAFSAFEEAFNMKTDRTAREWYEKAIDKLSEMTEKLAIFDYNLYNTDDNESLYIVCVSRADKQFDNAEWKIARFYYLEALKYAPDSEYTKLRADECSKLIKANITNELEKKYKLLINNGDVSSSEGELLFARIFYAKALEIKEWKKYPADKLIELSEKIRELKSSKINELYFQYIEKADTAFENRSYTLARYYYHKAELYKSDPYTKQQLAKIKNILAAEKRETQSKQYNENIRKGDEAFISKNLYIALFYYEKAMQVNPDEDYPKKQLQKIEQL